ncbi:MAG: nitrous oxide reductase accessory protein NosL [Vicinamibacterales bacterium]
MTRWLLAGCLVAVSCASGPARPRAIGLGQDACAHCRMVIVSIDTAAQIVAAGEEPRFFDEIGCLRDYLHANTPPADATVYVADHRTHEWVDARAAVFTRTSVSTPMASGVVAHADAASRDADPATHEGDAVARYAILGSMAGSATP